MKSTRRSRRHRTSHSHEENPKPFFSKAADAPVQAKEGQAFFQPKLRVGQPGDKYEREADQMADAVVDSSSQPATVQQKSMPGIQQAEQGDTSRIEKDKEVTEQSRIQKMDKEEEVSGGQEEDKKEMPEQEQVQKMEKEEEVSGGQDEEKEEMPQQGLVQMMEKEEEQPAMEEKEEPEGETGATPMQAKSKGGGLAVTPKLAKKMGASSGRGRKLPNEVRNEMEAAFGVGFQDVNIHTGQEAMEMNNELGAHAFTHGKDIFFNSGAFRPENAQGKHLLAHELAHVVQQTGGKGKTHSHSAVQPTIGDGHDLSAPRFAGDSQLEAAYDDERYIRRGANGTHVVKLQQALAEAGHPLPNVGIDGVFGQETEAAVRNYQQANGLQVDGIVGPETMDSLNRQFDSSVIAAIDWSGSLREQLRQLLANGANYAQFKTAIQAESFIEKIFALMDETLLRSIQAAMPWNDFARIVELLGRRPPSASELLADPNVQAALTDAWNDSNVAVTAWAQDNPAHFLHGTCSPSQTALPLAGTTRSHEEGGWIYFNVVTGGIYTRRAAPGAQAALPLANPPVILDSIVVGTFHTHPNVGACWNPGPSPQDRNASQFTGVPYVLRGAPVSVAATQDYISPAPGVNRRAHLAGPVGFPLAGGALAPQSSKDGKIDFV